MTKQCEYEILGTSADGQSVIVKYKNPYRTKSRKTKGIYDDVERRVPIQFSGLTVNEEETQLVIEQLASGLYTKMTIKHDRARPKKKAVEKAVELFGAPVVDPVVENEIQPAQEEADTSGDTPSEVTDTQPEESDIQNANQEEESTDAE